VRIKKQEDQKIKRSEEIRSARWGATDMKLFYNLLIF